MQIAPVHVVGARVCGCARGAVRAICIRRTTRAAGSGAACCSPPPGFIFFCERPACALRASILIKRNETYPQFVRLFTLRYYPRFFASFDFLARRSHRSAHPSRRRLVCSERSRRNDTPDLPNFLPRHFAARPRSAQRAFQLIFNIKEFYQNST